MTRYIHSDQEANRVAVELWRHALMHTGQPRFLRDETTGIDYWWLLHWHEQLPREQHYTFTTIDHRKILNLAVIYLIEDLKQAFSAYLADLSGDRDLQQRFEAVDADLRMQKIKV